MTNKTVLGVPWLKYLPCLDSFPVTIPRCKRCCILNVQNNATIPVAEDTGKGEGRKQEALFVAFTMLILYNEPPTKPQLSPWPQRTKHCLKNMWTKKASNRKGLSFCGTGSLSLHPWQTASRWWRQGGELKMFSGCRDSRCASGLSRAATLQQKHFLFP